MSTALERATLDNVAKTYSGKRGCMCGCQGKYSTPADSARSVKIIFNKVMNNPAKVLCEDANCYYVDNGTRNLVVYFKTALVK